MDRRANFSLLQARGGRVADHVALVNLTYKPLQLNLYVADAVNGPDGSLGLQPRAVKPIDLATWVKLATPTGKSFVVVPSRSTVIVPFTVDIPRNAYVGDHLAGIVASITVLGKTAGDKSTHVNFEQRVATRLAVRVAGRLSPQLTIEGLAATYAGTLNPAGSGVALLTYTVRNTGNVRLGGHQQITVTGLAGPTATAIAVPDVPLLLPGGSATITVAVPGVWPLAYLTANVAVMPVGALGDADPPAPVVTASAHALAIPWMLLGVVLILLLGGFWSLNRHRSSQPRPPAGKRRRVNVDGEAVPNPQLVTAGSHRLTPESTA